MRLNKQVASHFPSKSKIFKRETHCQSIGAALQLVNYGLAKMVG